MNKNHNISNLLKDKLNNQEFEIQDEWLNNMSDQLDGFNTPEEPNNKKGFFYIIAGILVVVGFIGALFVINEPIEENTSNAIVENIQTIDEEGNEDFKVAKKSKEEKTTSIRLNTNTENEYSREESNALENKNIKRETNTSKGSKSKKQNRQTKLVTKKKQKSLKTNTDKSNVNSDTKTIIEESKAVLNETKSNEAENNKEQTRLTKNDLTNSLENVVSSNNINSEDQNKEESIQNDTEIQETKNDTNLDNELIGESVINNTLVTNTEISTVEKTNDLTNNVNENVSLANTDVKSLSIENDSKQDTETLERELTEKAFSEELSKDSLSEKEELYIEKTKSKKELGISVSLTAGSSFLFRNFSSDNAKRNKEETNKNTWNASLEINKSFGRFLIGTGVQIQNYGEKINYTAIEYARKDTNINFEYNTYRDIGVTKSSTGLSYDTSSYYSRLDTIMTITDSLFIDNSVTKENGTTNFMYVEIPVQFGYKILDTKKFDIQAKTGVSVGFLTQSKGFYINNENTLQKAKSTNIMFNFLLSADFMYNIGGNFNLTLSPHFKQNLTNLSSSKAIKRNYSSFGINGGIILDF